MKWFHLMYSDGRESVIAGEVGDTHTIVEKGRKRVFHNRGEVDDRGTPVLREMYGGISSGDRPSPVPPYPIYAGPKTAKCPDCGETSDRFMSFEFSHRGFEEQSKADGFHWEGWWSRFECRKCHKYFDRTLADVEDAEKK